MQKGGAVLHMQTCKVCGKHFMSKRNKAEFCQDNSTCRVKWRRQQKRAQAEADKMTLDMETYRMYNDIITKYPALEWALTWLLTNNGKETLKNFMVAVIHADFQVDLAGVK